MIFHPENFIANLGYLVSGWLGVFIVIGIIVVITVLLNRLTAPKQEKDNK